MTQSAFAYLLIAFALIAANLPFVTLTSFRQRPVGLLLRLLGLLLAYSLVVAIGFAIESHLGKTTGHGWEFYAITLALFVTFAFPGFTYRYLLRHQ